VESGWKQPPDNPFDRAEHGWILGGKQFVERIRRFVEAHPSDEQQVPKARRLKRLQTPDVLQAVADFYQVSPQVFRTKRAGERSRNVAAWLARRVTQATLRELAPQFGLTHPESLSNLTRRVDQSLANSPKLRREIEAIKQRLLQ
jgi:chromosomal replication initiation ATPase DnaA